MSTIKKIMMLMVMIITISSTVNAQDMKKVNPTEIEKYLEQCKVYYLATVDADQPRVRPFGTVCVYEGKLYIQTGKSKNVFQQIAKNGKFEICGMKSDTEWIRISGKLVNDDRVAVKEFMLEKYPSLKGMYSATDDNTAVLYIEDGTATMSSFTAPAETVTF